MKELFKEKCIYIVITLFFITCGLLWFSHSQYVSSKRLIEEVEYYDSLNNYNKIYYSTTFKELKKENKQLYDSLKQYKDKIDYIVQFYHEKIYQIEKSQNTKPHIVDSIVCDTIKVNETLMAKTYEYTSEPNDTFQYNLNVNSYTEPNWYTLSVKTKNKFTIVNKEEDGINHITIEPNNGGTISNTTVYKKENKRTFWNRFSFGPSVTAGYDVVNRQWGVMAGVSATFDLTK